MASEVVAALGAENETLLRPHYSNSNEGRNEIPAFSLPGLSPLSSKDIDSERRDHRERLDRSKGIRCKNRNFPR